MIPLRDTISSKNYPIVNNSIIAVNIFFFLIQLAQGDKFNLFINIYGLVPAHFTNPAYSVHFSFAQKAVSLISFMFMHGGFWHLLGNMWSLYIFGDNIEDRLGHLRYLAFYLMCGLASGLFHMILNLNSPNPTVGASGAIAGVMGAYLILYPRSKILTLIPILFIPLFLEIPASVFLGIWFLLQFIGAAGSSAQGGGIAWWAHVGGFVAGILFLKMMLTVPRSGVSDKIKTVTRKKRTPNLQVIRPFALSDNLNLKGNIVISPSEAVNGTKKLVNIPWGFQRRLFRVTIPSGVKDGTVLKLKGLGKAMSADVKGDMLLKVLVRQ